MEKKIHIQRLEYFSKEIAIIKKKYKSILVKDIYTGADINPKDVKLFIKDCRKR